jgi:hypothetical protein
MAPAWSRGRPQQVGDVPAWTAGETHPAGDAPAWTAGEPHPASDVPARSIDDPQQTSEAAADAAVHTRDLSALPAGAPPAPAQGVAAEDAAADRRRDDSRGIAGVPDDGFGATSDPGPGSTSGETAGSILPDGIPLAGGDELMVRRQEATAADTASEHRPLSRLALGPGELAAVAAEIGAETQAPLLREEPGSARSGAVDLDGLMNRLVTELELEYLRLYGTGELGR